MAMRSALACVDIWKSFHNITVLQGVSFEVAQGEILALLGPSGSGKSTLLTIIAGLLQPDKGEVLWEDRAITNLPAHKRGFGLMFQDYVLFPHLDVFENIAFGLRTTRMSEPAIRARVAELLDLVGLVGYEKRDVNSLSGGEQQRVALARALAPKPRLLMLDEPLASVDRTLQEKLLVELRAILRKLNLTTIYVTHNQEEAFSIAYRVVLLRAGQIEQIGTPEEIYNRPASLFAARFLGLTNLIPGTAVRIEGKYHAQTDLGLLPIDQPMEGQVTVLIKPDAVSHDNASGIRLTGKVIERTFRGAICQIIASFNGHKLTLNFLSGSSLPLPGETFTVHLKPEEGILAYQESLD